MQTVQRLCVFCSPRAVRYTPTCRHSTQRRVPLALVRATGDENDDENTRGLSVDLFETAGTEKDSSSWEPFSKSGNTFADYFRTFIGDIDFSEPSTFDGEEKTEYDPLRDGPLRYLGYSNELGEAFAAWLFPGGVTLSYAIAIGYVLFDTVDKYSKTIADARAKILPRELPTSVDKEKLVDTIGLERGVDTLIWQLLASVAIPGYTIHTVVAVVSGVFHTLSKNDSWKNVIESSSSFTGMAPETMYSLVDKSVPTFAGLVAIPFIVHPIDASVHAALNLSLRPILRRVICSSGGADAGLKVCSKNQ